VTNQRTPTWLRIFYCTHWQLKLLVMTLPDQRLQISMPPDYDAYLFAGFQRDIERMIDPEASTEKATLGHFFYRKA
jgi:hypothetical protein